MPQPERDDYRDDVWEMMIPGTLPGCRGDGDGGRAPGPKLVSKHPRRPEGRAGVAVVATTPRGISLCSFDCRVAKEDNK